MSVAAKIAMYCTATAFVCVIAYFVFLRPDREVDASLEELQQQKEVVARLRDSVSNLQSAYDARLDSTVAYVDSLLLLSEKENIRYVYITKAISDKQDSIIRDTSYTSQLRLLSDNLKRAANGRLSFIGGTTID